MAPLDADITASAAKRTNPEKSEKQIIFSLPEKQLRNSMRMKKEAKKEDAGGETTFLSCK